MNDVYTRLVERVTASGGTYRTMDHPPEGRTDVISALRGNVLGQAAKAIILLVKLNKLTKRFVNAVVPGDRKLDLDAIRKLYSAERVMFAPADRAEALTGCVMGAVPPFTFTDELDLIVDADLVAHAEIVFNAGQLDRSMFVSSADFLRAVNPRVANIALPLNR